MDLKEPRAALVRLGKAGYLRCRPATTKAAPWAQLETLGVVEAEQVDLNRWRIKLTEFGQEVYQLHRIETALASAT